VGGRRAEAPGLRNPLNRLDGGGRVQRRRRARRILVRRTFPLLLGGVVVVTSTFLVAPPSVVRATATQPSLFTQTGTSSNITTDFMLMNNRLCRRLGLVGTAADGSLLLHD
jgi:hypothetical protein